MVIILDTNTCAQAVKQLQTDDKNTGIPAGSYIISTKIYDKIQDFLKEQAKAS